jgi:hypothetical protein
VLVVCPRLPLLVVVDHDEQEHLVIDTLRQQRSSILTFQN